MEGWSPLIQLPQRWAINWSWRQVIGIGETTSENPIGLLNGKPRNHLEIVVRVEGPVAHDVYLNFFERWNKQAAKYGHLNPIDRRIIDPGET